MEFNRIIKTKFITALESQDFKLGMDNKNEVEFMSANVVIRFVYNEREWSSSYFLRYEDFETEFENWVIEEFLGVKFEPVFGLTSGEEKITLWANERSAYFTSNTREFLSGNKNSFKELNEFFRKKNKEYNKRFS